MKYCLIILLAIQGYISYGQYNLVPNYSFEENVICPDMNNLGPVPVPWYLPQNVANGTCYLHACSTYPSSSVPNNSVGHQFAKTGLGYGDLDFGSPLFWDNRAYFQSQLKQPLIPNKCYYGEFWVSLNNTSRRACNNIAMLLTDTAIRSAGSSSSGNNGYDLIPANPQVFNYGNPIIKDTLNWVKISGVFTAVGGEHFITIGNFKNDANTQTVQVNSGLGTYDKAGYYIDDIRLIPLDSMVLKADAGEDRTIAPASSTYIGSYTNGLTGVTWYNSVGTAVATGVPGLSVTPANSTFYVMEQTVCGNYSRDTVYVNVGAVPLVIRNYELKIKNELVENFWATTNEVNVSHFNIQRSNDGINFYTIQKTAAKNNSYNVYSFVDGQPLAGTSYYRLECVDKDGKTTYSKMLSIAVSYKPLAVSIYPNPAKSKVSIVSSNGIHELSITDLVGRTLLKKQFNQLNNAELDIASLPKGIYLLKVQGNDGNWQVQKLLVE
jgi:hypothetical protein